MRCYAIHNQTCHKRTDRPSNELEGKSVVDVVPNSLVLLVTYILSVYVSIFIWLHPSRISLHNTINQNSFIQFNMCHSVGIRTDYNTINN